MDMKKLVGDQDNVKENLYQYVQAFSPSVRDIFERFDFYTQINRLAKCGFALPLLYQKPEIGLFCLSASLMRVGREFRFRGQNSSRCKWQFLRWYRGRCRRSSERVGP